MSARLTLIEAQNRYIARVNSAHAGHIRRVSRAAWSELYTWAEKGGYANPAQICKDAKDMAALELLADD